MTTNTGERLSRLEGAYEHMATKADLAELEPRLIKWMVGLIIGSVALACSGMLVVRNLCNDELIGTGALP